MSYETFDLDTQNSNNVNVVQKCFAPTRPEGINFILATK